jgi:hypothetical protein
LDVDRLLGQMHEEQGKHPVPTSWGVLHGVLLETIDNRPGVAATYATASEAFSSATFVAPSARRIATIIRTVRARSKYTS